MAHLLARGGPCRRLLQHHRDHRQLAEHSLHVRLHLHHPCRHLCAPPRPEAVHHHGRRSPPGRELDPLCRRPLRLGGDLRRRHVRPDPDRPGPAVCAGRSHALLGPLVHQPGPRSRHGPDQPRQPLWCRPGPAYRAVLGRQAKRHLQHGPLRLHHRKPPSLTPAAQKPKTDPPPQSSVCAIPAFFIPAQPPTPAAPSSTTPKLSIRASAKILFSQLEFWLLFIPFAVYVGFFNSISSLLNQILLPHGYSDEDAGIAGALLIVVGLVASAITSPLIDRTKSYLLAIRVAVPLIGLSYLIFVWMPATREGGGVAGPYVVMAVLGAASFSMLPIVVEYLVELTHPISPAVTSTLAWSGGQLLGGVFIVISGALKAGDDGNPPGDMKNALIFHAVVALVVVPLPLCLGMFGRADKLELRRVRSDDEARSSAEEGK